MRFLILCLLIGCATRERPINSNDKISGSRTYTYQDFSGEYLLTREIRKNKNKLITRAKLISKSGKELESQVSVSKIGFVKNIKNKNISSLLPSISQFRVWFDKKEYFSQTKILRQEEMLEVTTKSPEEKWNSVKKHKIPKGKYFCYFSQLPECLKLQNLLLQAARKTIKVFVIWDNFPYHNEQFEGLGTEPISVASLSLTSHSKTEFKYTLDIGNQIIFYHFNRKLQFEKLFWVSQGLSIVSDQKEHK
jgi:hypothetical protein